MPEDSSSDRQIVRWANTQKRRNTAFFLLLLVLGFTMTVASTWFYAGMTHRRGTNRLSGWSEWESGVVDQWFVRRWVGPGKYAQNTKKYSARNFGSKPDPISLPSWSKVPLLSSESDLPLLEDARGWPFLSFRCSWQGGWYGEWTIKPIDQHLEGGIPIRPPRPDWMFVEDDGPLGSRLDSEALWVEDARAIPLIPIWSGIFKSTAVWILLSVCVVFALDAPWAFRRLRRRRKNACSRCGYSLVGLASNRCPECGWWKVDRVPVVTGSRFFISSALTVLMLAATLAFGGVMILRFQGPTKLHLAACAGDTAQIKTLIQRGMDVDARFESEDYPFESFSGSTPLMWATTAGQINAVRLLIDSGAEIDATDGWSEWTAVHLAMSRGDGPIAALLLMHATSESGGPVWSEEFLTRAARAKESGAMAALLAHATGHEVELGSPELAEAFVAAVASGQVETMQLLKEAGASIDLWTLKSPISTAIEAHQFEAVKWLIDNGADVSEDAGTLLRGASGEGQTEIAFLLLDAGVDPNIRYPGEFFKGLTALQAAISRSDLRLTRALLDAGAKADTIDAKGDTLLFDVRWHKAPAELIDLALNLDIDVNHQSLNGTTALIKAVFWRRKAGVRALLDAGADPLIAAHSGYNALDHARRALDYSVPGFYFYEGSPPDPEIVQMIERALSESASEPEPDLTDGD